VRGPDRLLQRWRVRRAAPFVRSGDRLLDVGCHDRTLIDTTLDRISSATGVDRLVVPAVDGKVQLLRGDFPGDFDFPAGSFDCIALLAVLEHVADPRALARECCRVLAPGGRVVATVPHPLVDRIVDLGMRLHLLDGMAAEEHHGFDHRLTIPIFADAGFELRLERSFQLGLNRLFVFERPAADRS
jgi:SAM-dependent methyltransferase